MIHIIQGDNEWVWDGVNVPTTNDEPIMARFTGNDIDSFRSWLKSIRTTSNRLEYTCPIEPCGRRYEDAVWFNKVEMARHLSLHHPYWDLRTRVEFINDDLTIEDGLARYTTPKG